MSDQRDGDVLRVVAKMSDDADWDTLVSGGADAVHLAQFATASECDQLRDYICSHPLAVEYATAAGVTRLGSSFSDIRKTGRVAEEYRKPDVLADLVRVNGAIARLLGQILASWSSGIETLSYQGIRLHRVIARRIVGRSAEPHDDDIAKELPGDPMASQVVVQLGVNLYVETPTEGGELEGWRRRLSKEEYEAIRNPDPAKGYGVLRTGIGAPDWLLRPRKGDVVVFRNSELHAIRPAKEGRATCGFFLGYRGREKPLLIWS